MKKILSFLTVCALALSISFSANAQVKFGVKGGLNLTSLSGEGIKGDMKDIFKTYTGFHAGLALNIGLPLGFAIQPEVLYTQNGAKMEADLSGLLGSGSKISASVATGAIQVPIGIQWGIELGPIRPFVQAVPYISFPVVGMIKTNVGGEKDNMSTELDMFSSFDYGAGVGLGIDVWKIQISAKYNWSFGSYVKGDTVDSEVVWDSVDLSSSKISGFELSAAIFF